VTSESVREYLAAMRRRYQDAPKATKSRLLDEVCAVTGHHRKAAIRALNRPPRAAARGRRGRPQVYAPAIVPALVELWQLSDRLCGKRLAPFLPELLDSLLRHNELALAPEVVEQLLQLSPATIDRLLRRERQRLPASPLRQSRALSTVSQLVPVRTFGEWTDVAPGALQADLVLHSGASTSGFHLTTLVAVDVASGWTECQAVWGKGKGRVGGAIHRVRERLPMSLLSLHTDNGGEFLNQILYPWCVEAGITFTRGRPYKKNDRAYVEQRNWLVVRRLVGYDRYATKAAYVLLQRLYADLRLYLNYFQPGRKLITKERDGARLTKRYDVAQTPYRRLLASGVLTETAQTQLQAEYERINPVRLKARIDATLEALWDVAEDELEG
jgi:transposase InsO family protein